MGWKKTNPTVYLVSWDQAGIIKLGYSTQQRWRRFVLRGARVVKLWEFEDFRDAYALEDAAFRRLTGAGDLAFTGSSDAIPYLGDSGGWRECHRVSPETALELIEQCAEAMRTHDADA